MPSPDIKTEELDSEMEFTDHDNDVKLEVHDSELLEETFAEEECGEDLQQVNAAVDRVKKRPGTTVSSILPKKRKHKQDAGQGLKSNDRPASLLPSTEVKWEEIDVVESPPNYLDEDPEDDAMTVYEYGEDAARPYYLASCPMLRPEAPLDYPHLVDHERFNEFTITKNLRLCDGIATTLWNFDQQAFHKFFDPNIKTFEWFTEGSKGDAFADFVIRREGRSVLAGIFFTGPDKKVLQFDWYVKSQIDTHGKWTEVYGHSNGTVPTYNGNPLWYSYNSHTSFTRHPKDPIQAQYGGKRVARALIIFKLWDKDGGLPKELKWKAK